MTLQQFAFICIAMFSTVFQQCVTQNVTVTCLGQPYVVTSSAYATVTSSIFDIIIYLCYILHMVRTALLQLNTAFLCQPYISSIQSTPFVSSSTNHDIWFPVSMVFSLRL